MTIDNAAAARVRLIACAATAH